MRLGTKIFAGAGLVVVAALGTALLVTRARADEAAQAASSRALRATRSSIGDALVSRSRSLRQLTAALVQVPAYVSRIGESLRRDDRSNLLDQADELRSQTGADWVLIVDGAGVLKAWTAQRGAADEDFSGGALIGRALEGRTTEGLWIEAGAERDELYQAVGVPVADPSGGSRYGVVVSALRIDSLFAAQLKRHTGSEVLFFSRDSAGVPGVAVSTVSASGLRQAVRQLPLQEAPDDSTPARFRLTAGGRTFEGVTGLLQTADGVPIGGFVGLHDRDAELAAWRQLSRAIVWAFGGGLVLALVSSIIVARQITRPVRRLVAATREVSEGTYADVPVTSRDEIGELAQAFGRMVEELREKDRLVAYFRTRPAMTVSSAIAAVGDRSLVAGSVLAHRYEIEELLGRGGMGMVYRALDRQIGEPVAIKVLRPELGTLDPTVLERFKQELRLARRITHRNVVRTYDMGEAGGMYYITMELVRGTTLATFIRDAGRLDVPATLTIGKQLCRALEVAHDEGIVHRDIKPQNLLVDPAGFLKVMDFGIARLAERRPATGEALTAVGVVVGTPQYMAPEQLFGEAVDQRTDLYATGAVLFECVTGRVVFDTPNLAELGAVHLRGAPPDPSSINPGVPPQFSQVIRRALAHRPEDRWQSATELLRALESV
ncbi:MAG TPA: protein kinase [Gemmatimonadales bacterium]|nr:protein kinase [Gemmatimonadales bacterium]